MSKKNEISLLNTLFCILVIFIHIASVPISALDKTSAEFAMILIPWRLCAFVVQGFIFLSGLKLFLGFDAQKKPDYKKYYFSRLKKIVLPYVLWVVIFYLYFVKEGYFPFEPGALLKYIANGSLVSHFYFVIIILQFYALLPLWRKMAEKIRPWLSILSAVMIMLFAENYLPTAILRLSGHEFIYSDRIFTTYIIYWILGCYAGIYYRQVTAWIKNNAVLISVVFAIVASFEAVCVWLHFSGRYVFLFLDKLHVLYSLSAIFFFGMLALYSGDKLTKSKLFKTINGSSYYIYLMHPLLIYIINDKLAGYTLSQGTAMIIRALFVYIGSICLCGAYVKTKIILRGKKNGI